MCLKCEKCVLNRVTKRTLNISRKHFLKTVKCTLTPKPWLDPCSEWLGIYVGTHPEIVEWLTLSNHHFLSRPPPPPHPPPSQLTVLTSYEIEYIHKIVYIQTRWSGPKRKFIYIYIYIDAYNKNLNTLTLNFLLSLTEISLNMILSFFFSLFN